MQIFRASCDNGKWMLHIGFYHTCKRIFLCHSAYKVLQNLAHIVHDIIF